VAVGKRNPMVVFKPKGRPGRQQAMIEAPGEFAAEASPAEPCAPADLEVSSYALEQASRLFPGYDKYAVLEEWKRWALTKEAPKRPDAAFLAFFSTYAKRHPLPN
jgi:hypothetical protein